jgi:dynein heavy chain
MFLVANVWICFVRSTHQIFEFFCNAFFVLTDDVYEVTGTKCGGHLLDSRLKELLPALPVCYFKAVEVKAEWEACEVGYIKHTEDVYDCPIYGTTFRGPTYVVLATLKTVDPTSKWVLAGVAIIMQEDK